ncbi:ionotropic glutamate receptor [Elysia marginata]|uniref:Ionotropic glutamate receptor n=1 Tax=Elysia marginata TaxID=1093978 RepID=A0AAV4GSJ0_9GAST|nr:ionotropic glutamate receptor [Elysia marginata]
MFASYGALLFSNAAAPRVLPKINNLEDLLARPQFAIGLSGDSSYFLETLKKAKRGTTYARLWRALCEQNKSDPLTLSTDKASHLRRVLDGNYAFISRVPLRLLPTLVNRSFHNVRTVQLHRQLLYLSVPRNAFFKQDIERVLMSATEMGFIKNYLDEWLPGRVSTQEALATTFSEATDVHLYRLHSLAYIIVVGVGLAFISLAIEKVVYVYVYAYAYA